MMFKMLLGPIIGNHLAILFSVELVLGQWGQHLLLPLHLLAGVAVVPRDNLTLALGSSVLASTLDIVTITVWGTRESSVIGWSVG